MDYAPARAPPCFSHTESDWSVRSIGRHRVLHTPRAIGAPVRSGATVFFSHHENAWSARPLGHHRGFRTQRATGATARSGATVFFSSRERLARPSARAPPCCSHPEIDWITNPLGRHRVFYTPSALGAQTTPWTKTRKPDLQNLIFPSSVVI